MLVVLLGVGVLVHYYFKGKNIDVSYISSQVANKPTRVEQVESLISKLQADREQDPTFKAESARMEKELEVEIGDMRNALAKQRKAQSRLDALMVVQTQYDMEISDLQEANHVIIKK